MWGGSRRRTRKGGEERRPVRRGGRGEGRKGGLIFSGFFVYFNHSYLFSPPLKHKITEEVEADSKRLSEIYQRLNIIGSNSAEAR